MSFGTSLADCRFQEEKKKREEDMRRYEESRMRRQDFCNRMLSKQALGVTSLLQR